MVVSSALPAASVADLRGGACWTGFGGAAAFGGAGFVDGRTAAGGTSTPNEAASAPQSLGGRSGGGAVAAFFFTAATGGLTAGFGGRSTGCAPRSAAKPDQWLNLSLSLMKTLIRVKQIFKLASGHYRASIGCWEESGEKLGVRSRECEHRRRADGRIGAIRLSRWIPRAGPISRR